MNEMSVIKKKFVDYINHIVKNNCVSHAYLIEVNNYDDDLSYVFSFIKMILCNISYEELVQSDNPIISQIDHNNYPDITIISSETSVINKALLVDLQKDFSNKSLINGKKIYIIKEAEKLNGYSANTILKFLEEPQDDIIAILLTDNRYHVIDTILSRCQILSLIDCHILCDFDEFFYDFLDCIISPDNFFIKYNYYLNNHFVDKNVFKEHLLITENVLISYLENSDLMNNTLLLLLSKKSDSEIIHIISTIEDEMPKLKFNVNIKLWCDSFFAKLIGG